MSRDDFGKFKGWGRVRVSGRIRESRTSCDLESPNIELSELKFNVFLKSKDSSSELLSKDDVPHSCND